MIKVSINEDDDVVVAVEAETKWKRIKRKIGSATPIIAFGVYIILGYFGYWHPGWIVFLSIPLVPMILNLFGGYAKKNFMSVLTIVITIAYLIVGTCFHLWHPAWVMFLLIPIFSIFLDE